MNVTDIFYGGPSMPEVEKARKKMREFDTVDGGMAGLPIDMQLRTVLQALRYGISAKDWDGACEAFVMLQDAELEYRQHVSAETN